jgi:hypothetical protein
MVINTAFAGTIGWLRPGALHQHCHVDAADQDVGSGPWTSFRVWLSASSFVRRRATRQIKEDADLI